jgi:hypothetical protein
MEVDGDHPHGFHGSVADAEERQHEVDLLDRDWIIFVGIEKGDGGHDKDREHEESYVVVGHVAVEEVVVMVFLDEEIVVLFDYEAFISDEFGRFELAEQVVVHVGALLDESELGGVAVHHAAVEFALQEEGDEKPVDADEAVVGAFVEEETDGYDNCEGGLEDHVHVAEQVENQLQIYVLQLDQLRVRNAVAALLGHPQRLGDEFSGEGALNLYGQFMEEAFRMFRKEDTQKLNCYKFVDEVTVL